MRLRWFSADQPREEAHSEATVEQSEASGSLTIYGTSWCGDCRRSKRFLDQHAIPYRWIDIEQDEAAADQVRVLNHGMNSVPTIVFSDGSVLTEPSNAELGRKLGVGS